MVKKVSLEERDSLEEKYKAEEEERLVHQITFQLINCHSHQEAGVQVDKMTMLINVTPLLSASIYEIICLLINMNQSIANVNLPY